MSHRAMGARTVLGAVIWALLGLVGAASAQSGRRPPIFVGVVAIDPGKVTDSPASASASRANPKLRTCTEDWQIPTAIKKALGQMGEEIQDWPTAIPAEQCIGVACATRLSRVAREGYLLGGQISTQRLGPAHLDLWLVDLAARRILLAQHSCVDCEKPEVVARHAAAIVQRRTESQAPWFPLPELGSCSPPAEKLAAAPSLEAAASSSESSDRPRTPVLLAVYGTRAPEKIRQSITLGAKQYLELMGQSVQEFRGPLDPEAPRSALRPQQQASRLLDIEIQAAGHQMTDVLLRLSDAQETRQTTFQCASLQDCSAAALVQQVRLHVGTLVDKLDMPPQVESEAGDVACLPAPVCAAEGARFVVAEVTKAAGGSTPQMAPLAPMPSPAPVPPPPETTKPSSDGPGSQAVNGSANLQPGPTPNSMLTLCPRPGRARKLKIAGWSLVGLGGALVVAAIVPSVLSTMSGQCKQADGTPGQLCYPPPSPAPNLWPVAGVGYGLGALSIAGGVGLLVLSRKESTLEASQGGALCPH